MIAVYMGFWETMAWAMGIFAFGVAVGGWFYRHGARKQRHRFDRYRAAMLEDWREASDQVSRLRTIIRSSRSIVEARDRVHNDDRLTPMSHGGIIHLENHR